jgi:hypothetical protein
MGRDSKDFLKKKAVNGWNLFWLIASLISVIIFLGMAGSDLLTAPGVSAMIQLSARCAVPWLYLAFSASSLYVLFSSDLTAWVLRNRKYFGLGFGISMAWQAFFIIWMVGLHTDYYVEEVYLLRDVIEGLIGYAFLISMAITSFRPGRRLLSRKQWWVLHRSGIYFLWAYAFSVYWWAIFYYEAPVFIDHLFYWIGFLAWGVRAAAWHKERLKRAAKSPSWTGPNPLARILGVAIIVIGVVVATFGSAWYGKMENLVYGYGFTRIPELYLPYWPFEPFWSLGVIAFGTLLLGASGRGKVSTQALKTEQTRVH